MSKIICPHCTRVHTKDYKGNVCNGCLKPLKVQAPVRPMNAFYPNNKEQLEIKLVLENKELRKLYEDTLKEELKLRKINVKQDKAALKEVDKEEEKDEDESEEF